MNKEEFKNLPIGRKFTFGGIELKVVEDKSAETGGCDECYFSNMADCAFLTNKKIIPICWAFERKDKKNIVFKEVQDE